MTDANNAREGRMDATDLWREELITDRRVGTVRVLVPIRADGSADPGRRTQYVGEAQMMTNVGAMPISFDIDAATLAEAVQKYGDGVREAMDRAVRELQDLRRQAASSLVIPGAGAGAFAPGALPPGAGGGKIQLP